MVDVYSIIPKNILNYIDSLGILELRPSQIKSIEAGLFDGNNLLVCSPTASGKTLVGELALLNCVLNNNKVGVYVVPLRALASEKFKSFKKRFEPLGLKVAMSSGDLDEIDTGLINSDIIILTSEKFDSLIRHGVKWFWNIGTVVIDEIHLLNDYTRGPTLEVIITLLKMKLSSLQIIGLSATVGNNIELADWLEANLVEDSWRPVELKKGIFIENKVFFN